MKTKFLKLNIESVGLIFLLLILILPSWLTSIARVVNVDEPRWIVRGANFYYAITHKDFANTFYEYHPGVTNMWIVGTALHFYFPEYRGLGQGYFDPLKPKFEEFMRENGKEAIDLVRLSRYFQAAVLAVLVITAFLLLSKILNPKIAFVAIGLAVISPFYLGHSRLLNLEGMLSLFVLGSFLGIHAYLNKERKLPYLLISGVMFGLAQLTKSPSIVVVGLVGLMLLVELFRHNGKTFGTKFLDAVKIFAIWFATAALVYFILWPGMWVAPGKMLAGVYGNAFSYAFQGARLDVTEQLQPSSFSLVSGFGGILHFFQAWADSTTFLTWFGLFFALLAFFSKDKEKTSPLMKSTLVYLTVLGSVFMILFGVAQGRDSQHYVLSSYICFDVMAGIGWSYLWMLAQCRWTQLNKQAVTVAVFATLILAQIGFGLPYMPYYFTYKNPFAKQPATFGYGEGLAEAADYLAQKPNAKEIRAYVYNGMGTFSYFFPGETLVFKRVYLIDEDFTTIVKDIQNSDYLVLYPIVRGKQPETEVMFQALEGIQSEKTIFINGQAYVQIYDISKIPQGVFDFLLKQ